MADSEIDWRKELPAGEAVKPLRAVPYPSNPEAVAPLLLSYVIIGPLGANLLERRLGKKNPGYEHYIRTTSAFVPWPPKKA